MLLALAACATQERPKTVSDTGCIVFKPISFANAPADTMDDAGNKFDTPQTVGEIMQHNAAYDGACGVTQ